MIPDRLIECDILEATCVVNARGEVFTGKWSEPIEAFDIGKYAFQLDVMEIGCLTPCKPKPVFVEAVSVHGIHKMLECYQGHRKVVELQHSGCSVYFKTSDLAGIESIPTDQLEIVLRVKKVTNNV